MNIRSWTALLLMIAPLLVLQSCALFSPDVSQDDRYANDPVAKAALALRTQRGPASDRTPLPSQNAPIRSAQFIKHSVPGELTLGMNPSSVRSLWGDPQEIENAGDPSLGNQRWTYDSGIGRDWGTSGYRVIYFERNRVVGWENHR
jgi:hypothetical protein